MERFWFIPFVFHEPGEGATGSIYHSLQASGWSEEAGVTYSPLYYHKWSPEEETKWSWLIHYKKTNSKTGDLLNTWIPFYYNHETPSRVKQPGLHPFIPS
jgi:hypothetical protein